MILTSNCHHQTLFSKFHPRIYYPPPDYIEVRHYQDTNVDHIKLAIDLFDWEKAFKNTSVN